MSHLPVGGRSGTGTKRRTSAARTPSDPCNLICSCLANPAQQHHCDTTTPRRSARRTQLRAPRVCWGSSRATSRASTAGGSKRRHPLRYRARCCKCDTRSFVVRITNMTLTQGECGCERTAGSRARPPERRYARRSAENSHPCRSEQGRNPSTQCPRASDPPAQVEAHHSRGAPHAGQKRCRDGALRRRVSMPAGGAVGQRGRSRSIRTHAAECGF